MIITIKEQSNEQQINGLLTYLKKCGANTEMKTVGEKKIVNVYGDISDVDDGLVRRFDAVENVVRTTEKYKLVSRKNRSCDTVIKLGGKEDGYPKFVVSSEKKARTLKLDGSAVVENVGGNLKEVLIGGRGFTFIAGPCAVESEKQIIRIAEKIKKAGASVLRGGAFKPRTSPYDFQGLGVDGLKFLKKAKVETGMPIVSEIVGVKNLDDFYGVDIIQVGARNMQNFELLKELGKLKTPILLKRGMVNTVEELLLSAEYVMSYGNENVILCERGIRTFETLTRNTLDLSVIQLIKEKTHLPIIVDPSHATGLRRLVKPLSIAAAVVGADGVMAEVHDEPSCALCDGAQAIEPFELEEIIEKTKGVLSVCDNGKSII